MHDISGFGASITLKASRTFPCGFDITEFSDEADPFDIPDLTIADKAMGLNGDLVTWSTAAPVDITINIIPDGADDRNLSALLAANMVSKGKATAGDVITMTRVYPDGRTVTLSNGRLTGGPPTSSVTSAGRKKSKAYVFTFETIGAS